MTHPKVSYIEFYSHWFIMVHGFTLKFCINQCLVPNKKHMNYSGAAMRPGSRSGAWIARRKGASELHMTRVIQLALSENGVYPPKWLL